MVFFVIYLKYLVISKQTLIICLHEYKKKSPLRTLEPAGIIARWATILS